MRTIRRRQNPATEDLDLAPMLAMIVSLIPILLMAFSFYQTSVVETKAPQPDSKASSQSTKMQAELNITTKGKMLITIKKRGRVLVKRSILPTAGQFDFEKLELAARRIRDRYPEIKKLKLMPNHQVSYRNIIRAIDHTKSKNAEDNLFADVVFANVFKGY